MKRTLALVLLLVGCKEAHAPARAAAAPDLALPSGWSRGFGAGAATAPAAPTIPAAPAAAATPARGDDDDEPAVALPPELAKRAAPAAGVALYVDGVAKETLTPAQLGKPKRLDALAGATARSLFAHGANGNLWLGGGELARYQLRLNRRGQIKLEPVDAAGGGENRDKDARATPPERAGREHELRQVQWLELRTRTSPRLSGEP